ncbi:NUDIX domain-containing protein [Candidatus Woesearchaeota archaeon]|jgi:isopentenyl-diphosphate Delta-isomerase|nr:NUDIX domain-containing protein [Candidatus Woesearchaeota archaeon]MBT7706875.1 NUDIX domain-containing protein [archaeon]
MKELLEVYDLKGKLLRVEERSKYYDQIKKEFAKKGKISTQVKRALLILMNSKGRLVIQKRNKWKHENPGLFDKTIGGHVQKGDTFNLTIVKECAEELGFPVSILSPKEFNRAIKNTDLRIVGIFKKIDLTNNFQSIRRTKEGDSFIQPYISAVYVGYYNGPIQFIDGESSGIELFSLEELEEDIKNNPDKFTEDIKFMVKKYEKYLKPIKK